MPKQTYIINQFHGGAVSAKNARDLKPEEHITLESLDIHRQGSAQVARKFYTKNTTWQSAAHAGAMNLWKDGHGFRIFYSDIEPYDGTIGKYEIVSIDNATTVDWYITDLNTGAAYQSADTTYNGWFTGGLGQATIGSGTGPYDVIKTENIYLMSSLDHTASSGGAFMEIQKDSKFPGTYHLNTFVTKHTSSLDKIVYDGKASGQNHIGGSTFVSIGATGTSPTGTAHTGQVIWDISFGATDSGNWTINYDSDGDTTEDSYVKFYTSFIGAGGMETYPVFQRSTSSVDGGHPASYNHGFPGDGGGYNGTFAGLSGTDFGTIGTRQNVALNIHFFAGIYQWPSGGMQGNLQSDRNLYASRLWYSTYNNKTGEESELVSLAIGDVRYGVKLDADMDWKDYKDFAYTGHGHVNAGIEQDLVCQDPPILNTWEIIHGYRKADVFKVNVLDYATTFFPIQWKTSTIANGRTYIGNVQYDGKNFPDRIWKSALFEWGVFPRQNFLEVVPADGDEIIKIETFGDKMLVFKAHSLYVLNVSKEIEILEAEHHGMGCQSKGGICKFDKGIVWANKDGLYVFNGEEITNVVSQKLEISDDVYSPGLGTQKWNIDEEAVTIGYNPQTQCIVVKPYPYGHAFNQVLYSFFLLGGGFSLALTGLRDNKKISNFVLDNQSRLNCAQEYTTRPGLVFDKPDATWSGIWWISHEMDFGDPAMLKNIDKVYYTWRGTNAEGTMNVISKMSGDGGNSYHDINWGYFAEYSTGNGFVTVEMDVFNNSSVPDNAKKGVKSCRLSLNGSVPRDFMLEDVTVVYRMLGKR